MNIIPLGPVALHLLVLVATVLLLTEASAAQSLGIVDCRGETCVTFGWFDWFQAWYRQIVCWFGLC